MNLVKNNKTRFFSSNLQIDWICVKFDQVLVMFTNFPSKQQYKKNQTAKQNTTEDR